MHILKGRYERQVQVQALRLQKRSALVRSLLQASARHLVLQSMLDFERSTLQVRQMYVSFPFHIFDICICHFCHRLMPVGPIHSDTGL
jgi:hypothetical protein